MSKFLPCLLKITTFDNEGSSVRYDPAHIVFQDENKLVVERNVNPMQFFFKMTENGWVSYLDDVDLIVCVVPWEVELFPVTCSNRPVSKGLIELRE